MTVFEQNFRMPPVRDKCSLKMNLKDCVLAEVNGCNHCDYHNNSGLNLLQRLKLRLDGRVYAGHWARLGWSRKLPFFLFRCPKHGIQADYPHGYDDRLDCKECEKEEKRGRIKTGF